MEDVIEVARYVLDQCGSLSTMKLQKLVYYSQAYHLVHYGAPLFRDEIQAWANGPVVYSLFKKHQGLFVISRGFLGEEPSCELSESALNSVNHILSCFKPCSGAQLSELTHSEAPWVKARAGLAPSARGTKAISLEEMREFYSNPNCKNPAFS